MIYPNISESSYIKYLITLIAYSQIKSPEDSHPKKSSFEVISIEMYLAYKRKGG